MWCQSDRLKMALTVDMMAREEDVGVDCGGRGDCKEAQTKLRCQPLCLHHSRSRTKKLSRKCPGIDKLIGVTAYFLPSLPAGVEALQSTSAEVTY